MTNQTQPDPPSPTPRLGRLVTVDELVARSPLSAGSWRWLLFNRRHNGLASAVVRVGRRLLLDEAAVERWLESRREVGAA